MNDNRNINLIFDFDGCLIDSIEVQKSAFYESYNEVVGDNNCPSFDKYMEYTGSSLENVMLKLNLPLAMAESYKKISSKLINKIKINYELIELIVDYRNKGSKIAICTGKNRKRTIEILNYYHINQLFDIIVCSDDIEKPKPSPECILKVIKELNISENSTIYIGDGYNDYLCAKEANISFILSKWYPYSYSNITNVSSANTIGELKSLIDNIDIHR